MPISAYQPRHATVPLGKDNDFVVRAITFPDLAIMASNHMPALIAIVAKYQETKADVYSTKNIGQLALTIARDFPTFATEIISSCVVGETVTDETKAKIGLLPAPVQMTALIEISKLTVEEAGGLGNLVADLRKRMGEAMAAMTPATDGRQSE
ncbi:hypothetical protein [Sphingomonas phage Carli]|nr:hypothetical protein [Sphingomonas phage Carli]